MHLQSPLLKKFGIQSGHGARAALMFSYIFLIIASLLIVKPVRTSLFLSTCGAEQLPYVFMLVAIVSAAVAILYTKLSSRIPLGKLVVGSLFLSIVVFAVIWILLTINHESGWFVYFFYIWVAIFGVISASQFWLLANYVYNAREAKRIFGLLGAGAIAGGIFGGYFTNIAVPLFGTENMLLLCILFLIIASTILRWIWRHHAKRNYQEAIAQSRKKRQGVLTTKPLLLILRSKQLTYLSGLIGVGVLVASLVEFQFNTVASETFPDADRLTAFFGFWYSTISVAALIVQLFITGRLLSRFGVTPTLYFLPAGVLIGSAAVLFIPGLFSSTLVRVLEGGFKQSINKSGTELLALPIPSAIKNRTKIITDMLVPNMAEGLGGILLLLVTVVIGLKVQSISIIIFFILILWAVLIHLVKREYINSFRQAIEKRSVDIEELTLNVNNASVRQIIERVLQSENPRQVLYVLQLLEDSPNTSVSPYLEKLVHHSSSEVRAQVLRIARDIDDLDFTEEAEALISDSTESIRVAAIDYLCHRSSDPVQVLKQYSLSNDIGLQVAANKAAAILYRESIQVRKAMNPEEMRSESLQHQESLELTPTQKERLRASDAEIIGIAHAEELYPALHHHLDDSSALVLRAAVKAAGQTRALEFVPGLMVHLDTKLVRSYARSALAEYGDEIIEVLADKINDTRQPLPIRYGAVKVLSLIASQRAARELFQNIHTDNLELRFIIVRALNKIKDKTPELKLDSKQIVQLLHQEIQHHYRLLAVLRQHRDQQGDEPGSQLEAAQRLLERAIEERLAINLERIFRILALRYSQDDIYAAYLGIISRNAVLQANAVEFLDNILSVELKQIIIPLVEAKPDTESLSPHSKPQTTDRGNGSDYLQELLTSSDNWLNACVLYYIAEKGETSWESVVRDSVSRDISIVSETAQYAVNRLKSV
ncbi:MAG: MFS transporter [bacterium]